MGRRSMGAGVLVVTLLAAACGGGSDGASGEDFAAEANAVCRERQERIDGVEGDLTDLDATREVIAINETSLAELRDLEVPEEQADAADELWSLVEEQNSVLQAYADADGAADPDEVVAQLDSNAAEFDATASELGLDECTSGASAGADDTATEGATGAIDLADATDTLLAYLDAYFSGDTAAEAELTAGWAHAFALQRDAVAASGIETLPTAEATVDISLEGAEAVSAVDGGWVLVGDITATSTERSYRFNDVLLVEDPEKGLLVADYCRDTNDGGGPLDGCVSDAAARMSAAYSADDGSFEVAMVAMVRRLGTGVQSVSFATCLTGTTTTVSIPGGLTTSFVTEDDMASMPADGVAIAPAGPGEQSCGVLTINPPDSATDTSFPAGVFSFRVERADGEPVDLEVPTPALPQTWEMAAR